MGLFDRFFAGIHAATNPRLSRNVVQRSAGASGWSPALQSWTTGSDVPAEFIGRLRDPYSQHPTVHRAIRSISNSIAQLPVEVWPANADRKRDKPVEMHWLTDLLQKPNRALRGDTLMVATMIMLESRGEAFWWKLDVRRTSSTTSERPQALAFLHPWSMWPNLVNGEVVSWQYHSPGGSKTIPIDDLVFFRYYNPIDPHRGLGTLKAGIIEITGDHSMAIWNRSLFENYAVPPIVFTSTEEWPEDDRKAFITQWNTSIGGATRRGLAAAMPHGVKPEPLALDPTEVSWLMGRRHTREQINSLFGIPPGMAGVHDVGNFMNRREQMKFWWTDTLGPKHRMLRSIINADLLQPIEPENEMWFNLDQVMSEVMAADVKERIESAKELWGMGWPAAIAAQAVGLEVETAGMPWLLRGFLPFSVTPVESFDEPEDEPDDDPPPPPPDDDNDDDDGGDSTDDEGQEEDRSALAMLDSVRSSLFKDHRDERWQGLAARYGDIGRSYNRRLRSWLWANRRVVLTNLRQIEQQSRALTKSVGEDVLWDEPEATVRVIAISQGAWQRSLTRGALTVKNELALVVDFDLLNPAVVSFLQSKTVQIKRVHKRIRESVRDQVDRGINEGESVRSIAERVRGVFDVERHRALTIARTEVAQSFSGGRFEMMKQAGVDKHEWLSSRDGRVRETHQSGSGIDGESVVVGEFFSNGTMFPGDPAGPPGEIINCRCVTIPTKRKEESR